MSDIPPTLNDWIFYALWVAAIAGVALWCHYKARKRSAQAPKPLDTRE